MAPVSPFKLGENLKAAAATPPPSRATPPAAIAATDPRAPTVAAARVPDQSENSIVWCQPIRDQYCVSSTGTNQILVLSTVNQSEISIYLIQGTMPRMQQQSPDLCLMICVILMVMMMT